MYNCANPNCSNLVIAGQFCLMCISAVSPGKIFCTSGVKYGKSNFAKLLAPTLKNIYSSSTPPTGGPNAPTQSAADLVAKLCILCNHPRGSHCMILPSTFKPGTIYLVDTACRECGCTTFVSEIPTIDSSYTYEQQEIETMARLTSDLQDAGVFTTIPNGLYVAHVCEVRDTDKNDVSKPLTSQAGAPMVNVDWELEEGDFAGKKVKFDTIMLGGMSKENKPISLSNLCNFLHRTGTPWECESCKNGEKGRRFYIAEGNDEDKGLGLKKGNFYCPDCKAPTPRIAYDTVNFKGARCKIGVGSTTRDGREFNIVKGYTDL